MKYYLGILGLAAVLLSSCVANRKYVDAKIRLSELRGDSIRLARSLADCMDKAQSLQADLGDLQGKMNLSQSELAKQRNQLSSSQKMIADQESQLKALQSVLRQQKEVTDRLRKTIADALMKFKSDELTVSMKNGKVYVSMQEKLLFKSGSATVDPKGKEALATVAQVLNANPNINVDIEGHTDSIPIRGRFEDNWALSLARAASIVRILTNDYQVDPVRVIASGHSQFDPVETNSTPEGRARNRRTEIILAPNLDELYQLINQQQASDTGAAGI
ncbi:OmpA family protein [Compostibacter hankyongensis]|uniref:OmpA family protein n=1 Tax=Compostibacter hankyongensis TaxID=1007089 RepID=A0ABP8FCN3_9BACT